MVDCIFCKIIDRKISGSVVYEDEYTLAFLDIGPVNPGHTLVIPKKHYETLEDLPLEIAHAVIATVKKVGVAIKAGLNVNGYSLGVNNGAVAGQMVPHFHFHIMPRLEGDGLKLWPQKEYKEGEADEVLKKITSALI